MHNNDDNIFIFYLKPSGSNGKRASFEVTYPMARESCQKYLYIYHTYVHLLNQLLYRIVVYTSKFGYIANRVYMPLHIILSLATLGMFYGVGFVPKYLSHLPHNVYTC